jgi:hypothetical protein
MTGQWIEIERPPRGRAFSRERGVVGDGDGADDGQSEAVVSSTLVRSSSKNR